MCSNIIIRCHAMKKRAVEKEILDMEKAKVTVNDAIQVKESVLRQLESRIISDKEDWEKNLRNQRSNLELELKKRRKEVKKMQDEAVITLNRLSKQLQRKHENASNQLSERARQVELLHAQLSKMKIDLESRSVQTLNQEKEMQAKIDFQNEELSKQRKLMDKKEEELAQLLLDIESKQISLHAERDKCDNKKKVLVDTERKLMDYAQVLKKQGKDMKQKETDVRQALKLLSDEKNRQISNDNKLNLMVKKEQDKNRDIMESLTKLEEEMAIKEEIISQLQSDINSRKIPVTQQKLRELAQQLEVRDAELTRKNREWEDVLKEKEDQLSQERLQLHQKILKYNECESRLAAWQKSLEASVDDDASKMD